MGFDVGSRTVGIAVSDMLGWTAQGIETIPIKEEKYEFGMDRVKKIVIQYDVTGFIVGMPKNMNNSMGVRAKYAKKYGDWLNSTFDIPVDFQDERLTTVEAERLLVEVADTSRKKRKKVIDKIASVLILQNYLDRKGPLTTEK